MGSTRRTGGTGRGATDAGPPLPPCRVGRWAALGAAGLLLTGAAACAAPEGDPPLGAPTVSVPIQPTITPDLDTTPEPVDPSRASTEGLFDASSHLTTTECAPTGGTWAYRGTLENPEPDEQTFTVAVILVDADLVPVVEREVELTIAGGDRVPVEVTDLHTAPGSEAGDLECFTGVTVKGF